MKITYASFGNAGEQGSGPSPLQKKFMDSVMLSGGPAVPFKLDLRDGYVAFHGQTLRDKFAADALISMGLWCPTSAPLTSVEACDDRARYAYVMADSMLRAREE